MSNWAGKVYKKGKREVIEYWDEIRTYVIKRDRYRCIRCDKKYPRSKLNAHHLISRANGGGHHATNLVTLCIKCHDYVEIKQLTSIADIIGSYEGSKIIKSKPIPVKRNHIEEFTRPDWHAWVYGGCPNPNKLDNV